MSMVTKFITTTFSKLGSVNVVDGQVIALSDRNAWFYDMGGVRHAVISNSYCDGSLPASGEADTLYVLNGTQENSGVYIWASDQFVKLCGLDSEKVQTKVAGTGDVYLVAVAESADGSHTLVKNLNVKINLATREATLIAASAKSADKATNDGADNNINQTYIKGVSASRSGSTTTFTVTKGDNSTSTFDVEDNDTTYSSFTGADGSNAGNEGLVPAPGAADNNKFLKGDGSWGNPVNTEYSDMSGATSTTPGSAGLVPAPAAGDQDKFLKGDGTWDEVETTDTKNTAGATATTDKIYLIGAKTQDANPESFSNAGTYSEAGKLYSNSKEVVNLSDAQALTNKTYEGYTLGNIVEKAVASGVAENGTDIPTSGQVYSAVQDILETAKGYTDSAVGDVVQFSIEVVDALPTSDIKTNTIYLVPSATTAADNARTEYMYINSQWEIIGSTQIDLSDYPTTSQMNSAISSAISTYVSGSMPAVATSGSYNDLEDKPTIPTKFSDLVQDKVLLTDDVTGKVYQLGVSNGKICITEVVSP